MKFDDETLRALLREEAETVKPTGDGLTRIQERVSEQQQRRRFGAPWMRPVMAAAAALVLVAGGAVAYTQLSSGGSQSLKIPAGPGTPSPSASTSASPTTAPTTPPGTVSAVAAIWPVSADAGVWQTDPAKTALHFMSDFLQMPQLDTVVSKDVRSTDASVSVGRVLPSESRKLVPATTVHLVTTDGKWYVDGATSDTLRIDQVSGTAQGVAVNGHITGVDEVIHVVLRTTGSATPTAQTSLPGGGQNTPWQATLTGSLPTSGAVVAWTPSALDGAPAHVAVTRLGSATSQPAGSAYPSTFFAARDGQIVALSSKDGSLARTLTTRQPGGGDSDPQVVGSSVYFLRGTGSCGNALMRIPAAGGTPVTVFAPNQATIGGYGVSPDVTRVALTLQPCAQSGMQSVMVRELATGASHQTPQTPMPPMVVGNPAWTPDGTSFAGVLRTGNQAGVQVWPASLKSINDGAPWCGAESQNGLPQQVAYRPDGTLLVAAQNGEGVSVASCTPTSFTPVFAIPGTPSVTGIDATNGAVIIGTGTGDVEIVTGQTVQLRAVGQSPSW